MRKEYENQLNMVRTKLAAAEGGNGAEAAMDDEGEVEEVQTQVIASLKLQFPTLVGFPQNTNDALALVQSCGNQDVIQFVTTVGAMTPLGTFTEALNFNVNMDNPLSDNLKDYATRILQVTKCTQTQTEVGVTPAQVKASLPPALVPLIESNTDDSTCQELEFQELNTANVNETRCQILLGLMIPIAVMVAGYKAPARFMKMLLTLNSIKATNRVSSLIALTLCLMFKLEDAN